MKHLATFIVLVLFAISTGVAQDDAAVEGTAAEQPDVSVDAVVDDANLVSPLEGLDWMVGEWVDQGEDATIVTECSWTNNHKFLKRSYQLKIDDEVTLEGYQIVGWDPLAGQIRSWTFDSDGGFGDGLWIQDGNRWLVKVSFVLPDGARASALNVYTYVDDDTILWQSIDREVAGELQPSIPEVTVIRQGSQESEKEESQ
jgi:hypothetical protein